MPRAGGVGENEELLFNGYGVLVWEHGRNFGERVVVVAQQCECTYCH